MQLENRQVVAADDQKTVPTDLESFCLHYGFVMRKFMSLDVTDALAIAIDLSDAERDALNATTNGFFQRLQKLDRASMEVVQADDGVIKLKIPYAVDGRAALFDGLKDELGELLGSGRARIAAEAFYRNELIGSVSSERNFELERAADGAYQVAAELAPIFAYFPDTNNCQGRISTGVGMRCPPGS